MKIAKIPQHSLHVSSHLRRREFGCYFPNRTAILCVDTNFQFPPENVLGNRQDSNFDWKENGLEV
jgi:hypothetical protein